MSKTWNIYRKANGGGFETVATIHDLEYHGEWMADEYVSATIRSERPIDFHFGDYLYYRGEAFKIDYDPNVIKKARRETYGEAFVYENIKLYSLARELYSIAFKDYVLNWNSQSNETVYSSQDKFSFYCKSIEDLADRIQANLDRAGGEQWTVLTPHYRRTRQRIDRTIPDSLWLQYYHPDKKNISELSQAEQNKIEGNTDFNIQTDNMSCRGALDLSYSKFGLSYIIRNRVIIIGAPAIGAKHIFKYGKGNGAYEIERTCDDTHTVVTKLYAYGSGNNLPANYYANLHKNYYAIITKVDAKDTDRYNYTSFELDIDYRSGLFVNECVTAAGNYQVGWVVKAKIFDVEITCRVDNISADIYPKVRIYAEQTNEQYDPSDEPDLNKLRAFINNVNIGAKVVFTAGFDSNAWPQDHIGYEDEYTYAPLLSISNLMLPGFPDMSLKTWLQRVGNNTIISDMSAEEALGLLETYDFSDEIMSPWIRSKNADTIGDKEGSVYFDGSSEDREEILPTIEGTGAGVVTIGSDILDNGFLSGNVDISFYISVAVDIALDWKEAWDNHQEDIYLEMKSGFNTGRKFKLLESPKEENGYWKLKLERELDSSLNRYFPYYDSSNGSYCQIMPEDSFVVTGVQMPKSYVDSASVKLLRRAVNILGKIDHPKITYLPKVDEIFMARQHDEAVANDGVSLHDTLQAGMCMKLEDEDLNLNLSTYIDNITIKENGNNGIPTYDVVLRDEKDVSAIQRTIDIVGGLSGLDDLLSSDEIIKLIKRIGGAMFLSKLKDDSAQGHITFRRGLTALATIYLGEYAEGLRGGRIDPDGYAELEKLWVRTMATLGDGTEHFDDDGKLLPALEVKGDSVFQRHLSSPEFISGFPGGQGWALQRVETVNAAGVVEYKYTLEIDNVNVRNVLRVYEFIISQLLGENDNRIFTAMLEVDHYEPSTGKVWLSTHGGRFYNPFRAGDYIMVQQYQPGADMKSGGSGYITKHYELLISEVGSGGKTDENGDRLDWVKFYNWTPADGTSKPEDLIEKRDTFCRVDSVSDEDRKGIIQIMTVGPNTPYLDVIKGMKTNPNDYLKGRFGALTGIRTDLFGWLEGYGAYLNNLYAVGKFFNAQTGESLNARIHATKESLKSLYKETVYNISDEDNFLSNGFFQDELKDWTKSDANGGAAPSPSSESGDSMGVTDNGGSTTPMMMNGEIVTWKKDTRIVNIIEDDGVKVLHVNNLGVCQNFSLIKAKGSHKEMVDENGVNVNNTNYAGQSEAYYNGQGLTNEQIQNSINNTTNANKTAETRATQTKDVADTMYFGIRILPITDGKLSVKFLKSNSWTGFEKNITAAHEWQLIQATDENEAVKWDWTGSGKLLISYTGECYIRFAALMTDPIVNAKTDYSTLFEQNSRRITMQAAKESADHEMAMAQIQIQYNAISQVVTGNKTASDEVLNRILGISIDPETGLYVFPDGWDPAGDNYATWRLQSKSRIDDLAARWDPQSHQLTNYSTRTQTADFIREVIAGTATAGDWGNSGQALITAFSDFKTGWNTSLADGKIDAQERGYLESLRKSMKAQFDSCKAEYNKAKTNALVANTTELTTLTNKFNTLETKYNELDSAIDTVLKISGDIDVNGTHKTQCTAVTTKFNAFDTALKEYMEALSNIGVYADAKLLEKVNAVTKNFEDYQKELDDSIKSKYPNSTFISWVSDTMVSSMQVKALLNEDGQLTNYSTRTQTADEISSALKAYTKSESSLNDSDAWEQGTTDERAGDTYHNIKNDSSTRIRTKDLWPINKTSKVTVASGYRVFFVFFRSDKTVCSTTGAGWYTGSNISVNPPEGAQYMAILVSRSNSSAITPSSASSANVKVASELLVTKGEISLFIEDKDGVTISHAKIAADQIDFETGSMEVKNNGTRIFYLDGDGNLELRGNIYASNILGDIKIGSGNNKLYIRPNKSNGAELVGVNNNSNELINLGFTSGDIVVSGRVVNVARPKMELSFYMDGTKRMSALYESYRIVIDGPTNEQTYIDYDSIRTDRISADAYLIKTSSSGSGATYASGVSGSFTAGSKTVTVKGGIITSIA